MLLKQEQVCNFANISNGFKLDWKNIHFGVFFVDDEFDFLCFHNWGLKIIIMDWLADRTGYVGYN